MKQSDLDVWNQIARADDAPESKRVIAGVAFTAVRVNGLRGDYWVPMVDETGFVMKDHVFQTRRAMWERLQGDALASGERFARDLASAAQDERERDDASVPRI